MKKLKIRLTTLKAYVDLKQSNKNNEKNWNVGDFKIAVKALKTDKDGKMPLKR